MPIFELWCEQCLVVCPVVHSRVGKYPMQLGFWEYLLRKYYCEICLLCWDCQLSGAVSRRICKVTMMVLAMHQSKFWWAVASWMKCSYWVHKYESANWVQDKCVCVVGWPWLDAGCPSGLSVTPLSQLDRGEKITPSWKTTPRLR